MSRARLTEWAAFVTVAALLLLGVATIRPTSFSPDPPAPPDPVRQVAAAVAAQPVRAPREMRPEEVGTTTVDGAPSPTEPARPAPVTPPSGAYASHPAASTSAGPDATKPGGDEVRPAAPRPPFGLAVGWGNGRRGCAAEMIVREPPGLACCGGSDDKPPKIPERSCLHQKHGATFASE